MTCPQCGEKAVCVDSRERRDYTIRRRFHCDCGRRFTTIEQLVIMTRSRGKWTVTQPEYHHA
jgi:transcriptional regulator NrdR family protein